MLDHIYRRQESVKTLDVVLQLRVNEFLQFFDQIKGELVAQIVHLSVQVVVFFDFRQWRHRREAALEKFVEEW